MLMIFLQIYISVAAIVNISISVIVVNDLFSPLSCIFQWIVPIMKLMALLESNQIIVEVELLADVLVV